MTPDESKTGKAFPSQYELAKLAAILSQNRAMSPVSYGQKEAERSVGAALAIWREAGKQLSGVGVTHGIPRRRMEVIGRCREEMKVGKHKLPRIPDETFYDKDLPIEEFLKMAIGLSEAADRLKWLRAFVTNWKEFDTQKNAELGLDGGKARFMSLATMDLNGIMLIDPITFEIFGGTDTSPEGEPEKIISSLRTKGVAEPILFANAFRRWRLTMKTPTEKAKKAVTIEESILNALR